MGTGTETVVKTPEETITDLRAQIQARDKRIGELRETASDLQAEIEDFNEGELVKGLELYADPHNWTPDGRFSPVMKHIDVSDSYDPARRALDAYRG